MEPQIHSILHHSIAIYQSGTRGPAMVLCHGNSMSSRIFQKQFEGALARKFRLVAFDYPGHGRSGNASDPKDYALPGLAEVLPEDVRQLRMTGSGLNRRAGWPVRSWGGTQRTRRREFGKGRPSILWQPSAICPGTVLSRTAVEWVHPAGN